MRFCKYAAGEVYYAVDEWASTGGWCVCVCELQQLSMMWIIDAQHCIIITSSSSSTSTSFIHLLQLRPDRSIDSHSSSTFYYARTKIRQRLNQLSLGKFRIGYFQTLRCSESFKLILSTHRYCRFTL